MLPLALAFSVVLTSAAVLGQDAGSGCTSTAGQFGQRTTTCRTGETVCTTASHGGDATHVYYARTSCAHLAPAPPPADATLRAPETGPPIPGRGGARWEGDTDYTPLP